MSDFTDREILEAVKDTFGFENFKSDDQRDAAHLILSGEKNILISLATQAGKSLCYQLPSSLQRDGIILVVSPGISLISNHTAKLNELRIPAVAINSITPADSRRDIIKSLDDYENTPYRLIYMTPEMLVRGSESIRAVIEYLMEEEQISHLVIDEAHCVVDQGLSFRDAFSHLKFIRQKFKNIPCIALTTASEKVLENIAANLSMTDPKIFRGLSDRKNIFYDVMRSDKKEINFKSIIEDLLELDEPADSDDEFNFTRKVYSSGIIFCNTNNEADFIATRLCNEGVTAQSYYGSKKDVNLIQREWINGKFPVLVATEESFGFGINRTPLKFVVHFSFPKNLRAYYQQSGRVDADKSFARIYVNKLFNGVPTGELRSYIEAKICRHKYIGELFGDEIVTCEKMCDNCTKEEI